MQWGIEDLSQGFPLSKICKITPSSLVKQCAMKTELSVPALNK